MGNPRGRFRRGGGQNIDLDPPAITRLPSFAVQKGVAEGADGHRVGVYGTSVRNVGVYAESAENIGLVATGAQLAARFDGDVLVSGDVQLANADFAEDFDVARTEPVEPGTVMVLGDDGVLHPSTHAYDKRVAGIVSGAGDYRPGIVLDRHESPSGPTGRERQPIALLGKVYCKVDARYGPIDAGDLLTTSPEPGYAMKADDPARAFGAVIGKALRAHRAGRALIPVLVTLQ